mgnify:CR=1 FL=1
MSFSVLDAVTGGFISGDVLSMAVDGWLSFIAIEAPNSPISNDSSAFYDLPIYDPSKPNRKTTKITVTCIKDGKKLTKVKYTKRVKIKAENIKIQIKENKIKITLVS